MGPEPQAHQVEVLPLGWGPLVANWGHRLRPAVPAGAELQALPIRSATVACPLMVMLTYPLGHATTSEFLGRELPAADMSREDPLIVARTIGARVMCTRFTPASARKRRRRGRTR